MKIWRVGFLGGLVGGLVGGGLGIGLLVLIRVLSGMPPYDAPAAAAVGSLVGLIGFLAGLGGFTDWLRWALGGKAAAPVPPPPDTPSWMRYLSFDTNHKVIGIQYTVTTLLIIVIAGIMSLVFRTELAQPGIQFLSPDSYNHVMGVHGILMIAAILIGIAGISNYMVPILLGAADMAFPRLNALSFWLVPPAGILILVSLFTGGFSTGWTGYPPLGTRDPLGAQFFYLGVFVLGLSSILGSVNLITTILKMRAPGMSLFRMPIFCWSVLAASLIQLLATQFIAMAFLMVVVERLLGIGFFDAAKGGSALLYQNLFWFYSHPVVYVFVLPGFGIISELLPVFARKPLFGYRVVAISSMAIAFVGFLVWGHHMFATGMGPGPMIYFMIATLLVAVPTGVKIFSWLGTIWGGKLSFETPMLFVLGAIVLFLVGGLTGPFLALVKVDTFLTDTYWVVAHFHQIMLGGFVMTFLAAIYYWFPKITGYRYSELLGRINLWSMLVGVLVMTIALYVAGLGKGMVRRTADYDPVPGLPLLNVIATVSGFLIGLSMLVFLVNIGMSLRKKVPALANPWRSRSPEWAIPSPPPEENFSAPLVVVGDPYDYGVPDAVYFRFGEEPVAAPTRGGGE